MIALRYGGMAPGFTFPATTGGEITLAQFRGRADVVLAFYCYDWGGI